MPYLIWKYCREYEFQILGKKQQVKLGFEIANGVLK